MRPPRQHKVIYAVEFHQVYHYLEDFIEYCTCIYRSNAAQIAFKTMTSSLDNC